ncbi:ABC-F family ATP-binding cassette domain-containing protein [Nakamurella sp. GG22]
MSIQPLPAHAVFPHAAPGRAAQSTASTGPELRAEDLTKSYAGWTVLRGIDLHAGPGRRIGLIGENGAGKSTLLRLLAGVEEPDSGTVRRPADFGYLAQEPPFDDNATVATVLTDALAPLHSAVEAIEELSERLAEEQAPAAGHALADRYARVLEWAEQHDAWDADRRAKLAAHRLGLADLDPGRTVATLSGGQRTRLALAALITTRPLCVLLDEPTNHLDDEALDLLESFLVGLPGVVVAASHDRVFLDRVCTQIIDLDPTGFGTDGDGSVRHSLGGAGFTDYLARRADARRRWERTYTEEQREIAELRATASIGTSRIAHGRGPRDNDKFIFAFKGARVERTLARRVHDAQRRLAIAERNQLRRPPAVLQFRAALGSAGSGDTAVHVGDLEVPGRVSLDRLDVTAGERLLLTGANGSGKSSLLAVLAGRLRPSSGTVQIAARRVGLLAQDVVFKDPAETARATMERRAGSGAGEALTGFGLLPPAAIDAPIGSLSVGQRRRLALAILVAVSPDLLLLDEPTNHISPALATELEEALGTSAGTVILASHDRWLRRRWDGPELGLTRPFGRT